MARSPADLAAAEAPAQTGRLAADFYDRAYRPDQAPPEYGWWYRLVARWAAHREDVVLRLLPGGERLLDVGCGDARLLRRAAGKYAVAVGCDVSLLRLQLARRRAGGRRGSLLGSNVDFGLPFPDESFDAVTAVALLGHVFDVHQAVREFYRALRPGGVCIVHVANLAYLPRRFALLMGRQPWTSLGPGWDGGHLHTFTLGSLSDLLIATGFTVERVAGSGFLPWLRAPRRSLLSGDLIVAARR